MKSCLGCIQRKVFLGESKAGINKIISGISYSLAVVGLSWALRKWDIEHGTIIEVVTSHDLEVIATLEYSRACLRGLATLVLDQTAIYSKGVLLPDMTTIF